MSRTSLFVAGLAVSAFAGSPKEAAGQRTRLMNEGRFIGAQEIRRSGAKTVWDALRIVAPQIRFEENYAGQPSRMMARGPSTVALKDGPLVYVDGVRLADFRTLAAMPAGDVASIQIMNGIDGTTRYGTGASSGAIAIRTKMRSTR